MAETDFAINLKRVGWALAVPVLLAACTGRAPIDPQDAQQVARGEIVYREHCATCHGAGLEGQAQWRQRLPNGRLPAPPHDASGHTWHHSDELLINIVRQGMVPPWAPAGYESDMPAFGGRLADADIFAVLAYIQNSWPAEVREKRTQMLRPAPR